MQGTVYPSGSYATADNHITHSSVASAIPADRCFPWELWSVNYLISEIELGLWLQCQTVKFTQPRTENCVGTVIAKQCLHSHGLAEVRSRDTHDHCYDLV